MFSRPVAHISPISANDWRREIGRKELLAVSQPASEEEWIQLHTQMYAVNLYII